MYNSATHFAEAAGKEAGESWEIILNSFYELLGIKDDSCFKIYNSGLAFINKCPIFPAAAEIRGNRNNCAHFSGSLDWLVSRLERLEASSGRFLLNC